MSYTETSAGAVITLDINADGTLRAANVERRMSVTVGGQPRPDILTRDVLSASDASDILGGPLLSQVTSLQAQVATLTADLATRTAERDQARAQLGGSPAE